MSATVLVVEDERAIQMLISVNLKHAGFDVVCVGSVEEAEVSIGNQLPDIFLLDWMLPEKSGIDFAKRLRADVRTRDLPIIMLTAKAAEADKVFGLEAGADDYITKPFSTKELVARVRSVLRRRLPHLSDENLSVGALSLNPVSHKVSVGEVAVELGPTEFRLLQFFMSHPERVYSREQLLNAVWGDHVFIEERTVDVHIRRLRAALEHTGEDARIETVRGAGYLFKAA